MTEGRRAILVTIHGRVQGVGFRYWLQRMATQRAVVGWVRNNKTSKTVEALLCGAPEAIDDMLRLCRKGPPVAHVLAVEVTEVPSPDLDSFERRESV